ncbi:MAG TPA: Npt1/Npt2 family nucleotide transporter [Thermoanaerobaculia bacterium]
MFYACVAFMCAAAAGITIRTAAATLFLSSYEPGLIAWMYIFGAVLLTVTALSVGRMLDRFSPARVAILAGAAGAATAVLLWLFALSNWRPMAVVIYLASEVLARLPVLLFWGVAALLFNAREGKRLFVLVGAAGTLACAIAGATIRPFARVFTTEDLLLLVAGLLAVFSVAVARLVAADGSRSASMPHREQKQAGAFGHYKTLFGTIHPRNMAWLAIVATATLLIVDYVFKVSARANYEGDALAAFFGTFYSATSITALVFQLFLVHLILKKGGVSVALIVLPASLALVGIGIALTGGFGWVVAAKFLDSLFDFTINAAALQLLYLGVRKQSRGRVRALIEGTLRPVTIALAGLLLAVIGGASLRFLSVGIVILAVVWMVLAFRSYKSYVAGLLDSIGARRFDLESEQSGYQDRVLETHFRESLKTASDEEVPYLLGVIAEMKDVDWSDEYRGLLSRESATVRAEALDYLREHGNQKDLDSMISYLEDPDPGVRSAAVKAVGRLGGSAHAAALRPLIDEADPGVRASATAEVIRVGDIDDLLAACFSLKLMLESPDEALRAAAADTLAMVEHQGLARPLSLLIGDSNANVRLAALQACGARRSRELMPVIATLLPDPDTGYAAADALVACGEEFLPVAASMLQKGLDEDIDPEVVRVPAILARIGDPEGLEMLLPLLTARSQEMRGEAAQAYCTLARRVGVPAGHVAQLNEAIIGSVSEASARAALEEQLANREGSSLVCSALREEHDQYVIEVLLLLEAQHPEINGRSILFSLNDKSGEKRAEAIEVLDNLLDERVKGPLLQLLERRRGADAAAVADEQLPGLLGTRNSEWMTAGAAFLGAESKIVSALPAVRALLEDPRPAVRETALYALCRIGDESDVREGCAALADDPDINVRRYAASVMQKFSSEVA